MRHFLLAVATIGLIAGCSGEAPTPAADSPPPAPEPPDAATVIGDVEAALGMSGLDAITYTGRGWEIRNSFRQTRVASPPWIDRDEIMNYRRTIDLDQPASLATGEVFAQNLFYDPPTFSSYVQDIAADDTAWSDQLEIWLTPWGFIEGAQQYGAEVSTAMMDGDEYTVLSWMSPEDQTAPSGMRYTVNGYINADNLVERVETWVEDSFMGDLHVAAVFDDYETMNGLTVPTDMVQLRAGGEVFGVHVESAAANPGNLTALLTAPEGAGRGGFGGGPGGGQQPDPADLIEEVAPGVWYVSGGYGSLVVEFEDDLVVFESGQSEQRAETIMAAIESVSDKPVRLLVNSHPHSDHSAGLVPWVRAGVTLVVHENSVDFQRMGLSNSRDLLGEEQLNPQFETVDDVMIIEDSMNRLELHHVPNLHTNAMLFAYMPEHSLAVQSDFTVREGDQQTVHARALAEYVDENGLQFDRMLGVHAPPQPQGMEDLMRALPDDDM